MPIINFEFSMKEQSGREW